jgi:hypothetical protein
MKIEFSRAEIERIILDHANNLVPSANFSGISGRYSCIPSSVTVETKEEDAAQ